jgi:MoxR-like ATPase
MSDWKIFHGDREPHDGLATLPEPPPWRFARAPLRLVHPKDLDLTAEAARAKPFLPTESMVIAVNAALYLRRPLLLTGKPGTGKSTLIAKVAHELGLGPVIRWPINSRSTVRSGIYEYDAVGRLQAGQAEAPPVESYLTLGPLGTALLAKNWPRPLLIDEIDKSDLDFANDLLNVIEEGHYDIPELRRLGAERQQVEVRDWFGNLVTIRQGRLDAGQFPFVVMTSNAEREFPAPFLRRCVRLSIEPPSVAELQRIIAAHLTQFAVTLNPKHVGQLIDDFDRRRKENQEISTDQLLNSVFLTAAMPDSRGRQFSERELQLLRENLLRQLSGPAT